MTVEEYFERSRRLSVALTFILPLLIAYEVGVLLTGTAIENAVASTLLKGPLLQFFGTNAFLVFNGGLAILFLGAYIVAEGVEHRLWDLYLAVLVESAAFGAALGTVVLAVVGAFYGLPAAREVLSLSAETHQTAVSLVLSMGAGVYEELFFRLVLLGGMLWLVQRAMRSSDLPGVEPSPSIEAERWTWAALAALVVSSTLFAAAHYVGPFGDVFQLRTFAFRYVCGVILGVIYLWRGLGVAVYTHAFYDILIDLKHFA